MLTNVPSTVPGQRESLKGCGKWLLICGEPAARPPASFKEFRSVKGSSGKTISVYAEDPPSLQFASHPSGSVLLDGNIHTDRSELDEVPAVNDSTSILNAYLRSGDSMISKLKGHFSVIIWDNSKDRLVCVRDPLGIYPLFYAATDHQIVLSNGIDALLDYPGVSNQINRSTLADHLVCRWCSLDDTFYESIQRVRPGHVLEFNGHEKRLTRYWDVDPPSSTGASLQVIHEQFDNLLEQAVARCLQPAGTAVYLSGGLDSVSVAAVATKIAERNGSRGPLALSLVYPHPECNEEDLQKSVAEQLGLPQILLPFESVIPESDFLQSTLQLSRKMPSPLLNCWLPLYQALALQARERGCGTILTGTGGDEGLSVTPALAADYLRRGNVSGWFRLWKATRNSLDLKGYTLKYTMHLTWRFGLRPLISEAMTGMMRSVLPNAFGKFRRWRTSSCLPDWISNDPQFRSEMHERLESTLAWRNRFSSFYVRDIRLALEHPVPYRELEETFEYTQKLGMRILHPYWDSDLVAFLFRLPPELLIHGRAKSLVRKSVAHRFPKLGFERQKKVIAMNYFNSLILSNAAAVWDKWKPLRALESLGVVQPKNLHSYMENVVAKRLMAHAGHFWHILNTEAWLRGHS